MLSEKHGLQLYSCDEHAEEHWTNHLSHDPAAVGHTLMSPSLDERWLQPPEMLLHNVLRIIRDDFPYIIDDLIAMPKGMSIMVEGNIPPQLVEPLLTTKQQAIWMVPTDSFHQASFFGREKHLDHSDRSDPQQALDNHTAGDRLFTVYIKEEAVARGLELLEIDGSRSLSQVVDRVEDHFAPFLNPLQTGRNGA